MFDILQDYRVRALAAGWVEINDMTRSLLDRADSDQYSIAIIREAAYQGLLSDRRVLGRINLCDKSGARIFLSQFGIIGTAIRDFEKGKTINLFGVAIPPTDAVLSPEHTLLIEQYADLTYDNLK